MVGLSCGATECRAFLWQNDTMLDLNALISPDDDVLLTHAMDINDDGVITGRAFVKSAGRMVTYVARPIQTIASAGLPAHARTNRPSAIRLSAETLGQILYPLGPSVARLQHAR